MHHQQRDGSKRMLSPSRARKFRAKIEKLSFDPIFGDGTTFIVLLMENGATISTYIEGLCSYKKDLLLATDKISGTRDVI